MSYTFDWTAQSIKTCLAQRDRFLRHDIENGLEADPLPKALLVDEACSLYATRVSDNRYLLIWQLDREEKTVQVKFVIAKQYRGETPAQLKENIEKVLAAQSHGQFSLNDVKPLHQPAQAGNNASRPLTLMRPLRYSRKGP